MKHKENNQALSLFFQIVTLLQSSSKILAQNCFPDFFVRIVSLGLGHEFHTIAHVVNTAQPLFRGKMTG